MTLNLFSDRKILLGIGIGIVISSLILSAIKLSYNLSDYEVEKKALKMGMKYPDDVKVIYKEDSKK